MDGLVPQTREQHLEWGKRLPKWVNSFSEQKKNGCFESQGRPSRLRPPN